MATEHSAHSKEPLIILIVGTTARRFHTLFSLLYLMTYAGKSVRAFSKSFSTPEIKAIDKTLYKPGLFFPLTKTYLQNAFSKEEASPSLLLLECHVTDIRFLPKDLPRISTVVVTDVAFPDKEVVHDVEQQLAQVIGDYHIQNVLYNNDIYKPKIQKEEWAYIAVDRLPASRRYAYGTHEGNDFFTRREGDRHVLYMPNQKITLPADRPASFAYQEGVLGAYTTALFHQLPLDTGLLSTLQRVPLFEEYHTEQELFGWMKEYWYPEDMRSMLLAFPRVVMGANIYTRFQPVIEGMIEDIERLIIVPETKDEEELLSELFLQKEKDSYFTILYSPERHLMRSIAKRLWPKEQWAVLFDRPETFVEYMKK